MPVMGLDVGDRSLGIALSDPSHTIARGVEAIRGATFSRDRCLNRVKELVADEGVDIIVVGMPRNAAGEEGFQAQKVHTFISELRRWVDTPVVTFDERFSSVSAERALREGRVSLAKRKELRDKLAATIILQTYLDHERFQRHDTEVTETKRRQE